MPVFETIPLVFTEVLLLKRSTFELCLSITVFGADSCTNDNSIVLA
jgi:hypothetical protein